MLSCLLGRRGRIVFVAICFLFSGQAARSIELSPSLGLQGGIFLWPAYSNRDEVEADTAPGFSWAVTAGAELAATPLPEADKNWFVAMLRERLRVRVEVEVGQRYSGLHGINDGRAQLTGDGEELTALSAHLVVWPSWQFAERWQFYLGGGGGGTWIEALGSDKRVWSGQVGLGIRVALPTPIVETSIDLGWRSFFANSTKLSDGLTDYDTHGAILGVQFLF